MQSAYKSCKKLYIRINPTSCPAACMTLHVSNSRRTNMTDGVNFHLHTRTETKLVILAALLLGSPGLEWMLCCWLCELSTATVASWQCLLSKLRVRFQQARSTPNAGDKLLEKPAAAAARLRITPILYIIFIFKVNLKNMLWSVFCNSRGFHLPFICWFFFNRKETNFVFGASQTWIMKNSQPCVWGNIQMDFCRRLNCLICEWKKKKNPCLQMENPNWSQVHFSW